MSKAKAAPKMTPDELRKLREAAGLSQVGLSRALGIHDQTVSKWERGVYKIAPLSVRGLRAFFAELSAA